MVKIAASVVGLGLLFGLAIDPAWRNIKKLNQELPALRTEAATVKALADEARRLTTLTKASAPAASTTLKADTEKSLARAGLKDFAKLSGGDASGNTALQINFVAAPFDALIEWVNLAPRELSIRVQRAKVERTGGAGKVNAEVVFDVAGGAK